MVWDVCFYFCVLSLSQNVSSDYSVVFLWSRPSHYVQKQTALFLVPPKNQRRGRENWCSCGNNLIVREREYLIYKCLGSLGMKKKKKLCLSGQGVFHFVRNHSCVPLLISYFCLQNLRCKFKSLIFTNLTRIIEF